MNAKTEETTAIIAWLEKLRTASPRQKPLRFIEQENDNPNLGACCVCVSHRLNDKGYVCINIEGKRRRLHRYVYEKLNGPIPASYDIDHLCRTKACCNPAHLNALPSFDHSRKSKADQVGMTADEVDERKVAALWVDRDYRITAKELAELFGVEPQTVKGWRKERNRLKRAKELP